MPLRGTFLPGQLMTPVLNLAKITLFHVMNLMELQNKCMAPALSRLVRTLTIGFLWPEGRLWIAFGNKPPNLPLMLIFSSTLAWKIPWMEGPGRLQSMGLWRVRHDWATSRALFTFMHWKRKWQPSPVFLPGESQGWRSLVGCRLWGRTESDTTNVT